MINLSPEQLVHVYRPITLRGLRPCFAEQQQALIKNETVQFVFQNPFEYWDSGISDLTKLGLSVGIYDIGAELSKYAVGQAPFLRHSRDSTLPFTEFTISVNNNWKSEASRKIIFQLLRILVVLENYRQYFVSESIKPSRWGELKKKEINWFNFFKVYSTVIKHDNHVLDTYQIHAMIEKFESVGITNFQDFLKFVARHSKDIRTQDIYASYVAYKLNQKEKENAAN